MTTQQIDTTMTPDSIPARNGRPSASAERTPHPTLWGLSPTDLHDRFWAARGVQVVRPGEVSEIVKGAELFLLMGPSSLVMFRLRPLVDELSWIKPSVMWVRVRDTREVGYREMAETDEQGRFRRFARLYRNSDTLFARVALTPNRAIARRWQQMTDVRQGWRQLRQQTPASRRWAASVPGKAYDRSQDAQVMQFVQDLMRTWKRPDATIERVRRVGAGNWADVEARVHANVQFSGAAWIGAGRTLDAGETVLGPAVLWDSVQTRPAANAINWAELEPTDPLANPVRRRQQESLVGRTVKRTFDICFAVLALLATLPLFPLIMLAIYLDDGRPFFFVHWREARGGRVFPCLKFRSMRNEAEAIKAALAQSNEADGPQFFMENDPRLTRVGPILRRYHLDELPQFVNVLLGHMSVVGPRPSPYHENQCCPPWREARLSVRPGITGLWQVMRSRQRGLDFQEWIRYDIEYVEQGGFLLDMWIIWRTVLNIFGKKGAEVPGSPGTQGQTDPGIERSPSLGP